MVKGTSAQPVKRFFAFHSDWPCLTKQTLHVAASFQAILTVLRVDGVLRVGSLGCKAHAAVARRAARRAILALQLGIFSGRCFCVKTFTPVSW